MPSPIISRDPKTLAADPSFLGYVCQFIDPPKSSGLLPTPDWIPPDGSRLHPAFPTRKFTTFAQPDRTPITRHFETVKKTMPDGQDVEFWGFFDPKIPGNSYKFPSDEIRLVEGQIFHGLLGGIKKKAHTIHWHGIEPTSQNDGVGKLSMEVGGEYIYQWLASAAGTYFYHCHRNTLLHFEFGMYGMLLIDPLPPPRKDPAIPFPPYPAGGPGYVRRANTVVKYDKEAVWVLDDVDPLWHLLDHDAAMSSCDNLNLDANGNPVGVNFTSGGGLNVFNPAYFCISGVPHPWTRNLPTDPVNPGVAVQVKAGKTLLIRLLCGAYSLNKCVMEGLNAEVIAMDGRVLGQPPFTKYSRPFTISAGVPFNLTAARRFDLLISPTAAQIGTHRFVVEFQHHVTRQVMGIAETFVNVVP
ncbi:MAG: multicopper oxidase domain-containing protein [Desulfobaccales bacterium]